MPKLQLTSAIKDSWSPEKLEFPCMSFRKIDGVRAGHLHGFLHGRSLDPFKNTALNAKFADKIYTGFDGELTIGGALTDKALKAMIAGGRIVTDEPDSSLCSLTTGLTNRSKLKPGELALPDNAVWNLFDYLHDDVIDLEYLQRYEALERYLDKHAPPHVRLLPFKWIRTPEEAAAWVEECLELTFEGAIFRNPRAKHKSGRATAKLGDFWRYKPKSDKDGVIVGYEAALANNNEATINSRGHTERSSHKENKVAKDEIGKFSVYDLESDRVILVGPGTMSLQDRRNYWADPAALLGHPMKYNSLDTGVKDKPRQAFFHSLRSWEDMDKLSEYQKTRVAEMIKAFIDSSV